MALVDCVTYNNFALIIRAALEDDKADQPLFFPLNDRPVGQPWVVERILKHPGVSDLHSIQHFIIQYGSTGVQVKIPLQSGIIQLRQG
ncbi:hypothetical protein D3C74_391550 [compost metagenome]